MMRYVRDDAADDVVRKHEKLQDVVHGRAVMLWLPATASGLAVQAALLLGAAGPIMAVVFMRYRNASELPVYIGSLFALALVTGLLFRAVVRGTASGRTRMYRMSLVQLCLGACVVLASIARGHTASTVVSTAGTLMSFVASRLIAGPDYALWSAIYRAQRVHLDARPKV